MPKINVFACPSCGASLSVDDDGSATTVCQFCGNTVIIPEELRSRPAAPAVPVVPVLGPLGFASPTPQQSELGNLIRAGNLIAAIKLYREIFGASLQDAKTAVEALAAGQSVTVMQPGMSIPTILKVAQSPTSMPGTVRASPVTLVPPVIMRSPNVGRSLGCSLALTLGIIVFTFAIVGVVLLATLGPLAGLSLSLPGGLSGLTNQYAHTVLSFGGEGTGPGLFQDPRAIAVDADGNIYVGDYQDRRIQVFDPTGKFVNGWQVGEKNQYITGLAVSRDGTLNVVFGSEIHRYDASGQELDPVDYADGWGFESVAAAADGGLVAAWYKNSDDLVRFDADGQTTLYIPQAISSVSGDSELDTKVAVDGLGNIYALGTFNNAVFRFSPDGQFVNRFGSDGDEKGQFRAPNAIAVDGQSRVYVSDIKGIQVFDADGRYLASISVPNSGVVFGMAFDDQNGLYVVANNKKVFKFAINS